MDDLKVLMVGNAPAVKGGITSVITQLLNHNWENDGIKMSFIPTYDGGSAPHKVIYFVRAYANIKKQIQSERPDILHIHMSYKGSFTRKYVIHKLCVKRGVPDVIHLHGSEFKKWYDKSSHRTQEKIRSMLRECNAFIVLGNKWESVVEKIEPNTKTVVVSNAIRIPDKICSWSNEQFQVLYLGVLIKRKGVADFLKAIKIIKDSGNFSNMKFVIAGSGDEENTLREEARILGIERRIEFKGWVSGEQKEALMRESQLLVLPSYNEGLPIAILEAISYGLPVVATDVGDISSAVIDGQNGYLVSPGNINQLAESILKICNNKELYMKMSGQSRTIAEMNFSDKKYFENIISCYRKAGGGYNEA